MHCQQTFESCPDRLSGGDECTHSLCAVKLNVPVSFLLSEYSGEWFGSVIQKSISSSPPEATWYVTVIFCGAKRSGEPISCVQPWRTAMRETHILVAEFLEEALAPRRQDVDGVCARCQDEGVQADEG